MSRNGSGAYSLPAGNPVTTGTAISSTVHNATMADIATALTGSLAADGQTTVTANLPMSGYKLTGLGAGTVAGDSLRFEQLPVAASQAEMEAGTEAGLRSVSPLRVKQGGTALIASGTVLVTSATGVSGYGAGSGGTVTQDTSRGTAVTLNKPTGQITMFSAAGSAGWSSFVVNNSLVAATDTVVVGVKGGAVNSYLLSVNDVSAGSFRILFATTSGTSVDAPVINFTVIKGAAS